MKIFLASLSPNTVTSIIQFAVKMKKRYEDIPCQFVPKHSHKYLMRKTLVNTKFQWLMKYLNQQNQDPSEHGKLSKIINIVPKHAVNPNLSQQKVFFSNKTNHLGLHQDNNYSNKEGDTSSSSIIKRKIKSRINTEPAQDILFMEKGKLKKSLLMSRSKSKNFPLLCHQTINQKLKTTQGIRRSKTSDCRKPMREKENFSLTPWVLPEENHQITDLVSYF